MPADGPPTVAPRGRVSAVVPVFERADYLVDALASVEQQTWPAHEIIVVVDGPPVDLAPALARVSAPVRILRRPHGGPGAARNTACAVAAGDIFAFLDSDDVWLPKKLERQVQVLASKPSVDAVFAGVEPFFSPELQRGSTPRRFARAERAGLLPSAMVVRASSFWRVGGFPEGTTFGELLHWYALATDLGLGVATVAETLVRRRIHEHNAGLTRRDARTEYAEVVKAMLDRRRRSATDPG